MTGEGADLERLVEWSDGEGWQIFRHEKRGMVLCDPSFECEHSYECVGCIADKLIAHINRSTKHYAPDFQGVSRAAIIEQRPNRDNVIVPVGLAAEVDTAGSIGWVKRTPDGAVTETSEGRARTEGASGIRRLVRLHRAHPHLADALRYLQEEPGMPGLYKVGEVIECAMGGEVKKLGTSRKRFDHFMGSTQPARHHRRAGPSDPMTEREAEAYIRALLDKLIAHLDSTT